MRTLYTPVTIYTRPGDEATWRLMDLLDDYDVSYEVVNLDTNDEARTYVEEILFAGDEVPIICTDIADPIIGYDYNQMVDVIEALSTSETGL